MSVGIDDRRKVDRRILIIFSTLMVALTALATVILAITDPLSYGEYVGGFMAMITVSFFGTGLYAYFKYRGSSLIPRRRITRWILKGSLILSLIATVILFIVLEFFPSLVDSGPFETAFEATVAVISIFIAMFVAFVLSILLEMMAAFGAIGVMSALERRLVPRVLREITTIADKKKLSPVDHVIRWFFAIPDVVDTKLLDVHPEPRRPFVRRRDMVAPLEWQLLFGAVLAMYISLNPFIAESSSDTLALVFSAMTNGAILIPVVILPWFALQRLGAGIAGGRKEFTLYQGVRSRLLQTFFAIGTLLLLIRVLISGTDVEAFVRGFSSFMMMLLLISLITTFVYLNFFENELVEDIAAEFKSVKRQNTVGSERPSADVKPN